VPLDVSPSWCEDSSDIDGLSGGRLHVRRLLIGGVVGVVMISLAACGSASGTESTEETQRQADY
jgi:hypothetical protein